MVSSGGVCGCYTARSPSVPGSGRVTGRPPASQVGLRSGWPDRRLDERRGGHHALEADAVLDAQAVEQVDEVLGREVAHRARTGERAAAEAARGAVDHGHAPLERRVDVGQGLAARVVGVQPDAPDVDQRQHGVEDARDVAGGRRADRVAEADLVAAEVEQPAGHAGGRRRGHLALVRAAERDRHVPADAHRPGCRVRHDAGRVGERLLGGPVEVGAVERIGRADDDRDLVGARGDGALEAAQGRARAPGIGRRAGG